MLITLLLATQGVIKSVLINIMENTIEKIGAVKYNAKESNDHITAGIVEIIKIEGICVE